jgi:hypothetical protein
MYHFIICNCLVCEVPSNCDMVFSCGIQGDFLALRTSVAASDPYHEDLTCNIVSIFLPLLSQVFCTYGVRLLCGL